MPLTNKSPKLSLPVLYDKTGNGSLTIKSNGMAFYTACSVFLDGVNYPTPFTEHEFTFEVPYPKATIPPATPTPAITAATATPTASVPPANSTAPAVTTTPKIDAQEQLDKGEQATVASQKFTVTSTSDGNKTAAFNSTQSSKATTLTVPATVKINGVTYKVTTIAENAFKGNKKIKKITISKNINTISKGAFSGCSNLKKIIIKSSSIRSISKNAFKNINKKAVIDVPNKMLKQYKKLLRKAGLAKTVKIK